jgi:hypothetical protein
MKKHGDLIGAFHYLKTFHRKLGEASGPYEKLIKGSLYEWFARRGELKPHVKIIVEKRTTSTVIEKQFSILETIPELKDELITLLKNMHVVKQGLFAPIVQLIIKGIFESRAPELLKDFTKQGGFKVSLKWTKNFMKYHLN